MSCIHTNIFIFTFYPGHDLTNRYKPYTIVKYFQSLINFFFFCFIFTGSDPDFGLQKVHPLPSKHLRPLVTTVLSTDPSTQISETKLRTGPASIQAQSVRRSHRMQVPVVQSSTLSTGVGSQRPAGPLPTSPLGGPISTWMKQTGLYPQVTLNQRICSASSRTVFMRRSCESGSSATAPEVLLI